MIRSTKISAVLLVLRLALGGLMLFAAYNKVKPPATPVDDPIRKFMFSIEAFEILPPQLIESATFTMPLIEIVCGVLLILGIWTRSSSLVLAGLTASFVYVINRALMSGNIDVDCGCFGDLAIFCPKDKLTVCHVWRSSAFVGVALILLLFGAGRFSLDAILIGRRPKVAELPDAPTAPALTPVEPGKG